MSAIATSDGAVPSPPNKRARTSAGSAGAAATAPSGRTIVVSRATSERWPGVLRALAAAAQLAGVHEDVVTLDSHGGGRPLLDEASAAALLESLRARWEPRARSRGLDSRRQLPTPTHPPQRRRRSPTLPEETVPHC